jgi:hypothetical protein
MAFSHEMNDERATSLLSIQVTFWLSKPYKAMTMVCVFRIFVIRLVNMNANIKWATQFCNITSFVLNRSAVVQ